MSRKPKSRGMTINRGLKLVDRTGQKFGRLTAAWPVGAACSAGKRKVLWLCFCDCGKSKIVRGGNLKNGHVRSCGCYTAGWLGRAHRTHGMGHTTEYRMWCDAKKRAEAANVPFTIKPQEIVIPKLCPFLEIPLFVAKGQPGRNSPSLDRIKRDLGYVPGNIRVISYKANSMKSDSTIEEFVLMAKNWRALCALE
jgi:hypothetical protein